MDQHSAILACLPEVSTLHFRLQLFSKTPKAIITEVLKKCSMMCYLITCGTTTFICSVDTETTQIKD